MWTTGKMSQKNSGQGTLLLSLLKGALWGINPDPSLFGKANWKGIVELAQIETVSSLAADGIALLPKDLQPPLQDKLPLIACVQANEAANKKHIETIGLISESLEKAGIPVAFMKGQVTGSRYPKPLHRQQGDIDFVVKGSDMEPALQVLESLGATADRSEIDEQHGKAFLGDVLIEPHYKIHNYQRPSTDKMVQNLFDEVFPSQLIEMDFGKKKAKVLPLEFESLFLISHIVHHVYGEGLGLRQVVDYAMFIDKCWNHIDTTKHSEWLKMARMMKPWRIIACICIDYLGAKRPTTIKPFTKKEKSQASRLLDDIISVGNFGRNGYTFHYDSTIDVLKNYLWVIRRCLRLGFVCPSEARWWPFSKLYRFIGKKLNKS